MKNSKENWTKQTKKNTHRLFYWTITWTLSVALAQFGAIYLWDYHPIISTIAITFNFLLGIGLILVNKKYLEGLDEMQRKIQLDSMAISLGLALILGVTYSLLDSINIISYDAEISHLLITIGLTYIAGIVIGTIRYQ